MKKNTHNNMEPKLLPEFDDSILQVGGNELLRAVQVMPLNEFRFQNFCKSRGIVTYLPLRKAWKVHNFMRGDRSYSYSRVVLRPMFPSYVFVKTTVDYLRTLYDSRALVRFFQPADQEAFREEIRTVRIAERVGMEEALEIHKDIPVGGRFLIQSGIWEGVTGWLSRKDDIFKWTVKIEFVDQLVTATIDPSQFKMMPLEE